MVIHLFSLYKTVNKKKKQKARNEKKKKCNVYIVKYIPVFRIMYMPGEVYILSVHINVSFLMKSQESFLTSKSFSVLVQNLLIL